MEQLPTTAWMQELGQRMEQLPRTECNFTQTPVVNLTSCLIEPFLIFRVRLVRYAG